MFGLFKSAPPFSDPALGELVRSRGLIELCGSVLPP